MPTEALFRDDAYLTTCDAKVASISPDGAVVLDRTIFYATGGGQPGDCGFLETAKGERIDIATTKNDRVSGDILHIPADAEQLASLVVGDSVVCHLDWTTRYKHMRIHTALHLLSVAVPFPVTGGQIGAEEGRLDFNIPEPDFDKEGLSQSLMDLVNGDHAVSQSWITDEELDAKPDLVKTMSVQPPRGAGKVRLISIGDVDLQPCGGTHVQATREIGQVAVTKIENKGKQNRRIRIRFVESEF